MKFSMKLALVQGAALVAILSPFSYAAPNAESTEQAAYGADLTHDLGLDLSGTVQDKKVRLSIEADFDDSGKGSVAWGVEVEGPTDTTVSTDDDVPTTRSGVDMLTTQPVTNNDRIPATYNSVKCELAIEWQNGWLHLSYGSTQLEDALSGYDLNPEQLEKIRTRCGIEDGESLLRVVEDDHELICSIALRDTFSLPGDGLVLIMPASEYNLHETIMFNKDIDTNVTFCGVADVLEQRAGDSAVFSSQSGDVIQSEYLVNNDPVNIPPREMLTCLRVAFPAKSNHLYAFFQEFNGILVFFRVEY